MTPSQYILVFIHVWMKYDEEHTQILFQRRQHAFVQHRIRIFGYNIRVWPAYTRHEHITKLNYGIKGWHRMACDGRVCAARQRMFLLFGVCHKYCLQKREVHTCCLTTTNNICLLENDITTISSTSSRCKWSTLCVSFLLCSVM